jgi:ABC-type branched-subunit amino acid transport system permease subunit
LGTNATGRRASSFVPSAFIVGVAGSVCDGRSTQRNDTAVARVATAATDTREVFIVGFLPGNIRGGS